MIADELMSTTLVRVRPGGTATHWLSGQVRALQAGDPLRAVTVVVATNRAGLHLRRRFAAQGYANVRFTTLARLAETLGSGRLAAAGQAPLQAVTRAALIRTALRTGAGALAPAADQPGLVDLIARLTTELRRRDDLVGDRARMRAAATGTSDAVVDTVATYEELRGEARLYDEVDLRVAAAAAVGDPATTPVLDDLGVVIVHLPDRLDPPDVALLRALRERTSLVVALPALDIDDGLDALAADLGAAPGAEGQPEHVPATITVMIAPDPVEEVRGSVRAALAAAETDGIPLHRTAIVYGDADTYADLLRDTLDEAGVPQVSLDGLALAEAAAARALLGLVRLRDQGFTRAAVLSWLSTVPSRDGVLTNQARWDKLSRDAGVVRGVEQWQTLLLAYAGRRAATLAGLDDGAEDSRVEAHRAVLARDVDDARQIAQHVAAIEAATRPPEQGTWEAYVDWALRLRTEFVTPDRAWTAEDREALQAVDETIGGLGAAHPLEPSVSVSTFLRALEDGLRGHHRPIGRMGTGILTGPHHLLLGIDVARIHVLGALEGAFPSSPPVDPLLTGDPLDRQRAREARERRDWLAAIAAADGGHALLSAPAADMDGRAVYPSPWLLETLADRGPHPRASEVRSGAVTHPRLQRVASADHALLTGTPLSVAERREADALAELAAGHGVRGSALARRQELPLGRALSATAGRRSSELTGFDGDISGAAAVELIARGLAGAPQSATGVQTWATCPFHYLLGRVLAVTATEDVEDDRWWRIDAAERGSLIHKILQTFFDEVRESGEPAPGSPYGEAQVRRIESMAQTVFDDAESRGVTGHPIVWDIEKAAILADLRSLLDQDADQRSEGWRPSSLEQPFGIDGDPRSWSAVEVVLDGGRSVALRGYIDRIDLDRAGRARVIDYKTGKAGDDKFGVDTRFDGGRRLQLPIYGRAVRDRSRAAGDEPPETTALYWYATLRGDFKQQGLAVDDAAEETLGEVMRTIDAGVRAGCFPQVPGEFSDYWGSCDNCTWCDYDTLCPAGRDVLAAGKAASPRLAPYRALQPSGEGVAP